MGTPASVACDPPQCRGPEARARKRAAANIFQDVGLLQLRRLFRSRGDERAEERARLVWEYAGDRRTAQALRQLRRRRWQPAAQASSGPRLEDCSSPSADAGSSTRLEGPSRDRQRPGPRRKCPRTRRRKKGPGPTGYLHQLQQ